MNAVDTTEIEAALAEIDDDAILLAGREGYISALTAGDVRVLAAERDGLRAALEQSQDELSAEREDSDQLQALLIAALIGFCPEAQLHVLPSTMQHICTAFPALLIDEEADLLSVRVLRAEEMGS